MRLVDAAADLLLGSCCPGCDEPGFRLCSVCRGLLAAPQAFRLPGLTPPVVAAGPGDALVRRLVSAHKERSAWYLARPLGDRLAGAVDHLAAGLGAPEGARVVLVPVPSTRSAVRRRGYDATAALAVRAAKAATATRAEVHRALRHTRAVQDQSGLDRAERTENLRGALVAMKPTSGRPAIVVDDLTTSGATLAEALRALCAGGWSIAGAAVVGAVGNFTGDKGVNHW